MMNDLYTYFNENKGRLIHKWSNYFEIYDNHFNKYRNTEVTVLEIGVSHGGSLQMWKNYFGNKAKIYGIDIDPVCKNFEEENISIFIGSQSDRKFLRKIVAEIPPIDILIDDGGHKMDQQIITFEELFDKIKDDGIFLCEDIHTSYWKSAGGGYRRRGTFVEYSKSLIDYLHAWHSEQLSLKVNKYSRAIWSVNYYHSIVVIQKREMHAPEDLKSGSPSFNTDLPLKNLNFYLSHLVTFFKNEVIERCLAFFRFPSIFYGRRTFFRWKVK